MTEVQGTIHQFYSQFCLAFPESIIVDNDTVFPYITYDYKTNESMSSQSCSFQIWDRADNVMRINNIADKIEKSIPPIIGVLLIVKGNVISEWQNPISKEWVQFDLMDLARVAKEFQTKFRKKEFVYRQRDGQDVGTLKLTRGVPFIQSFPVSDVEKEFKRYIGNIEIKHYLL